MSGVRKVMVWWERGVGMNGCDGSKTLKEGVIVSDEWTWSRGQPSAAASSATATGSFSGNTAMLSAV